MEHNHRITIIDYEYHQDTDLIYLDVTSEEKPGKLRLGIYGKQFVNGFGIHDAVSPDLMVKFLEDLKGKKINWMTELSSVVAKDVHDEDSVQEAIDNMEEYPFNEIKSIEEQN